jgi:hypothetical protein
MRLFASLTSAFFFSFSSLSICRILILWKGARHDVCGFPGLPALQHRRAPQIDGTSDHAVVRNRFISWGI